MGDNGAFFFLFIFGRLTFFFLSFPLGCPGGRGGQWGGVAPPPPPPVANSANCAAKKNPRGVSCYGRWLPVVGGPLCDGLGWGLWPAWQLSHVLVALGRNLQWWRAPSIWLLFPPNAWRLRCGSPHWSQALPRVRPVRAVPDAACKEGESRAWGAPLSSRAPPVADGLCRRFVA